jgi:hypothetical protein
MMRDPGLKEDSKNLSLVGASACVAALLTAGLLIASANDRHVVRVHVVENAPEWNTHPTTAPLSGANRLYGTVHTVDGGEYTGYIRWDRNEASWTDLLDATKPTDRGGSSISGIRFGHIDQIEILSRSAARFTLKSGEIVDLTARATDLGSGLRSLVVDSVASRAEFQWEDLDRVDFMPPPPSARPDQSRLFGTLTTRTGMEFTGHVTWDVDEVYTSDLLDGDLDGQRLEIAFGTIHSIERFRPRAALVVLNSGQELILDGTKDVDRSIGGISVSDARLGQIKLDWAEFDRVVFHGTDDEVSFVQFDGGTPLRGTVVTSQGEEISGEIRWDMDQAFTWEMLTGVLRNVELKVEFGQIERIRKSGRGSEVTLRDGRVFQLSGTNDVGRGNRGIEIRDGGRT